MLIQALEQRQFRLLAVAVLFDQVPGDHAAPFLPPLRQQFARRVRNQRHVGQEPAVVVRTDGEGRAHIVAFALQPTPVAFQCFYCFRNRGMQRPLQVLWYDFVQSVLHGPQALVDACERGDSGVCEGLDGLG